MTDTTENLLARLNDSSRDTFDEGDFGPWSFTSLTRDDAAWTLQFKNRLGSDQVTFTFAGSGIDETGGMSSLWFDELSNAIFRWEGKHSDDGDDGYDGDDGGDGGDGGDGYDGDDGEPSSA